MIDEILNELLARVKFYEDVNKRQPKVSIYIQVNHKRDLLRSINGPVSGAEFEFCESVGITLWGFPVFEVTDKTHPRFKIVVE